MAPISTRWCGRRTVRLVPSDDGLVDSVRVRSDAADPGAAPHRRQIRRSASGPVTDSGFRFCSTVGLRAGRHASIRGGTPMGASNEIVDD
jgi:hypothetical protein